MSLLQVGAQCSLSSCAEVDFLPVNCFACASYYCRNHYLQADHACPSLSSPKSDTRPAEKLERCAIDDCTRPSLSSYTVRKSSANCPRCLASFCAHHRHPISHSCPIPEPDTSIRNETARALLAKNFPATEKPAVAPRIVKIPTDPVQLANYHKVQLIKMRQTAKPLDPKDTSVSVPISMRHHFKTKFPDGESEKVFWIKKTVVAGRVLDLIASHLKLMSSSSLEITGTPKPIEYGKALDSQIADGSVVIISEIHQS
ncbi:hypothetical protein C8J56DRAFT_253967 [Mycena floridula]|nr:hypothetical protein C8J56DRAFT_253967 [Mycena floridula]